MLWSSELQHRAASVGKMEAAWPSEMLVSYHIIELCHNTEDNDMTLHH